jgi:hypothetical protein
MDTIWGAAEFLMAVLSSVFGDQLPIIRAHIASIKAIVMNCSVILFAMLGRATKDLLRRFSSKKARLHRACLDWPTASPQKQEHKKPSKTMNALEAKTWGFCLSPKRNTKGPGSDASTVGSSSPSRKSPKSPRQPRDGTSDVAVIKSFVRKLGNRRADLSELVSLQTTIVMDDREMGLMDFLNVSRSQETTESTEFPSSLSDPSTILERYAQYQNFHRGQSN